MYLRLRRNTNRKALYFSLNTPKMKRIVTTILLLSVVVLTACLPELNQEPLPPLTANLRAAITITPGKTTAVPTRQQYKPGELVDYTVQDGDTLPALAVRFNTTEKEIRQANKIIPEHVTSLPPGMPMKIPIYYQSLWGSPYKIIPDSLFVNGPSQVNFRLNTFVSQQPGWLKSKTEYLADKNRTGGDLIEYYAQYYSVSPQLLLALLEYQAGALTKAGPPDPSSLYLLGNPDPLHQGLANQLVWASNLLNDGYYNWRAGKLKQFELKDGKLVIPDPWQNAATVSLQYYFSRILSPDDYYRAISPDGLAKTFTQLFGDPWKNETPHIPGSLEQPALHFPFDPGKAWAFTGGPHTAWGDAQPFAALDFAPPAVVGGCTPTNEWATAVADGVIARTETALVYLDLDGDGDDRTGWVIFYLHLANQSITVTKGTVVKTGTPLGHPSCEGGRSTGTHVHIARKYNGEWMLAEGPLAFNLEGWVAHEGLEAYEGYLDKGGRTVIAGGDYKSQIESGQD